MSVLPHVEEERNGQIAAIIVAGTIVANAEISHTVLTHGLVTLNHVQVDIHYRNKSMLQI